MQVLMSDNDILNHNAFLSKSTPIKKSLMCHLWETSVMAECQCRHGILRNVTEILSDKLDADKENIISMICFIAAMHDIGKIHPLFQKNIGNSFYFFEKYPENCPYRHEVYGANLVEGWLYERGFSRQTVLTIKNVIYMHHMGKKDDGEPGYQLEDDETRILEIGKSIFDIFLNHYSFSDPLIKKENSNGIHILLEGSLIICDWGSSRAGVFDNQSQEDFSDFELYVKHLREQADNFIRLNMMNQSFWNDKVNNIISSSANPYSDIFGISDPRPMQVDLQDMLRKTGTDSPTFWLIEDLCGGGKTEAAELAALMLSQKKAGIYMAMPTGATADAMHQRFQNFIRFSCSNNNAPLYTSKAWLSEDDIKNNEENSFDKSAWISEPRAKLMYPSAIGTIDQIIQYSHMMKFGQIGLVALTEKTIIIDEIHDYDSYMLESIYTLLDFCGWAGISVIACSATLSDKTKRKLINAYLHLGWSRQEKINVNGKEFSNCYQYSISDNYPLITAAQLKKDGVPALYEKQTIAYATKSYRYNLVPILEQKISYRESLKIAELAMKRIENGGCLAISMNTVDEARSVYDACKRISGNIPVLLYLARTSPKLLNETAKEILYLFGKKGKAENKRPSKAIVVCTPILQQSMDVDFDYMIVELRPADALIQILGRYRRHDDLGTIREGNVTYDAVDVIYSPNDDTFQRENKIYRNSDDPEAVKKTFHFLSTKETEELKTPDDIRWFINTVYSSSIASKKNKSVELIKSAYSKDHPYRTMAENERLVAHVDTRISDYPTVNVLICNQLQYEQIIRTNGLLDHDQLVNLVKSCSVANVPQYLLGSFAECSQRSDAKMFKGRLREYEIFIADDNDEVISGNKKMWIDKERGLITE